LQTLHQNAKTPVDLLQELEFQGDVFVMAGVIHRLDVDESELVAKR